MVTHCQQIVQPVLESLRSCFLSCEQITSVSAPNAFLAIPKPKAHTPLVWIRRFITGSAGWGMLYPQKLMSGLPTVYPSAQHVGCKMDTFSWWCIAENSRLCGLRAGKRMLRIQEYCDPCSVEHTVRDICQRWSQSNHHRQLAGRLSSDRFVILLHNQFADPVSLTLVLCCVLCCAVLLGTRMDRLWFCWSSTFIDY